MIQPDLQEAVHTFGAACAVRFATGGGEPEDLLRGPFENLLAQLAGIAGIADVVTVVEGFLRWEPIAPRRPRELALTASRLCRLLRAEIDELLADDEGLRLLAEDWRVLLFPEATDTEFADGYAQTITFALLLARVEGIEIAGRDLRAVADELGATHTLMGRALDVLTSAAVLPKLAVSVQTLQRVLGVVDWPTLSKNDPAAWLYFYEDFLEGYDPALRKATGSYYTPVEVVDPMVRMVDDLLKTRFGHANGLASADVKVVDPAAGTGTFLFRVVDRIARAVEEAEGGGAVGPRLRQAAQRLVGFELQAGPYSVAELRLATEFARLGSPLGPKELRLYLTDTLGNPYVADEHLPAFYAPIALSRQRANEVKRNENVMVVIGNPPYHERSKGHGGWVEQGSPGATQVAPLADFMPPKAWKVSAHVKHLYNPYVYFWRWATWKVFEEHPGNKGVIAFITVAGFINGPGFGAMRSHLRRVADEIWVIDCSPEGHQPDVPTRVFPGVQRPICITIALRDGASDENSPASVRFTSVAGRREEKFAALAALDLDGSWASCPDEWTAPFLPRGAADWARSPALDDLLSWSGSGTMPGRTWVISPSAAVLKSRWKQLITAAPSDKKALLSEHPQDRTIHTLLSDNLPGYARADLTIADETGSCPEPVRYGFRSFDRQWIIPDKRVINRPNPSLWQVRSAPGQLYLTALHVTSPSVGPAVAGTAVVPDLDHFHGRGGRAWPLWLDSDGLIPNVLPGLLPYLEERYDTTVSGSDFFAYVAGVAGSPAYTARFAKDLGLPGLRVPLSADPDLFRELVIIGQQVLWLQTFGQRFSDGAAGRPPGSPMLPPKKRPKVIATIPDTEAGMPATLAYDAATKSLLVGAGRIAPVEGAVWEYEMSGVRVVKRWFDRRKKEPEGRRSSPLDAIVERAWSPDWTTELLELLNVLGLLVQIEPKQSDALERVVISPLITVADLTATGLLPVSTRLKPEKPEPAATLFDDL